MSFLEGPSVKPHRVAASGPVAGAAIAHGGRQAHSMFKLRPEEIDELLPKVLDTAEYATTDISAGADKLNRPESEVCSELK